MERWNSVERDVHRARINIEVGHLLTKQGDLAAALSACQLGLDIFQNLHLSDPNNTSYIENISASYNRIGIIFETRGDISNARNAFQKSLSATEALVARYPRNERWLGNLSVCYERLGNLQLTMDDLTNALNSHQEALAISEELAAAAPTNPTYQRATAVKHQRLALVFQRQGNPEKALASFGNALAICRNLVSLQPDVDDWQFGVANNMAFIGIVLHELERLPEALKVHSEALGIRTRLAEADPSNAIHAARLIVSRVQVAKVLAQLGEHAQADKLTQDAISHGQTAAKRFPHVHELNTALRDARGIMAVSSTSMETVSTPEMLVPALRSPSPAAFQPKRDLRAEARAALRAGHSAQALALLTDASDDGRVRNLRAICLLRLSRPEEARDSLYPALFPSGGTEPADATPDSWIINYATAQFLAGDPRGCRRSLGWLKNSSGGATRLRKALDAWDRTRLPRGVPPSKPSLPFALGEF